MRVRCPVIVERRHDTDDHCDASGFAADDRIYIGSGGGHDVARRVAIHDREAFDFVVFELECQDSSPQEVSETTTQSRSAKVLATDRVCLALAAARSSRERGRARCWSPSL